MDTDIIKTKTADTDADTDITQKYNSGHGNFKILKIDYWFLITPISTVLIEILYSIAQITPKIVLAVEVSRV